MVSPVTPHPFFQLMQMVWTFQLPRALMVAARLDLGHWLQAGPRASDDLAAELGLEPSVFYRFMRFLADNGIFDERPDRVFVGTDLSEHLHFLDSIFCGDEAWAVWSALPDALASGESNFAAIHGLPFFEYAAQHPDRNANWKDWTTTNAVLTLPGVVPLWELSGSETVVDVGGGQGNLLAEVLSVHPDCRGILYDLPEVVNTAPAYLRRKGVLERCEIQSGTAFEHVPAGGDVYVFSRVLGNWDDDGAAQMLRNTAEAMTPQSRLVAIDSLLVDQGQPFRRIQSGNDLHLLLVFGSRHRTREAMTQLFESAGFVVESVRRLGEPGSYGWDVIDGRKREPTSHTR